MMDAPDTSGTVRYEPATVRGTLGRLAPYIVGAAALLVVNETTDLLGGEAFMTWFAVGTVALVLGILAVSYASRGNAALELGSEALRAGKLLVPWRCVARVELAATRTDLDVEGGPVLEWLLLGMEDGRSSHRRCPSAGSWT